MSNNEKISQASLVMEYFISHPNQDIHHSEIVPWLMSEYEKRNGKPFADPDRQIRMLSPEGFLIKKAKGIYRYDPDAVENRILEDFSEEQKETIKKRDGYRCVVCGKGTADGVELQVDHIKPKDLGGEATIDNGQTLCAKHNFMKKNINQTETGKKMFIRLYELAKSESNNESTAKTPFFTAKERRARRNLTEREDIQ
jgi:predicted restriction endonuclease